MTEEKTKLERIYEQHSNVMYNVAYSIIKNHHSAEDAVSHSFERILKNLHKIDENNFYRTRSFVCRICRNVTKSMLKKNVYLNENSEVTEYTEDINLSTPEKTLVSKELFKRTVEILYSLDSKYRDVLLLKNADGLSRKEIAEILNINEETVKKRLLRANEKVRNQLIKEGLYEKD